jgi:hypothetical protein
MDFNPDEYLAEKPTQNTEKPFDPDEYLGKKVGPPEPQKPWAQAGPITVQKNPADVNWLGEAKKGLIDQFFTGDPNQRVNSLSVGSNPLFAMSGIPEATVEGAAQLTPKVTGFIKGGLERLATSPIPQRIANTVSGIAKGVPFGGELSKPVQALPEAQKGVAWALDHAPQTLGKFAPILKNASKTGAAGVATADFLLSQKNPEYQELKKKMYE